MASKKAQPRTFFLNERHELSPGEKAGGGRLPKFAGIDWASKGARISSSLTKAAEEVSRSPDPLSESRFFLLADPVESVTKRREDREGNLKEVYEDRTAYASNPKQSRTFDRLGLDLLQITGDGRAIVHGERTTIDKLAERTASLATLGPMEQSRWATIEAFEPIPFQLRVDDEWARLLSRRDPSDVIVELQPVLGRLEADTVLRAIATKLRERRGESVVGTGTDYSGRHWFRARMTRDSVNSLARDYQSVQSLHPPLYSLAAATGKGSRGMIAKTSTSTRPAMSVDDLPCVAVVDLGVPRDHKQLAPYRVGQFVPPDAARPPIGSHGSYVASRVVFGEFDDPDDLAAAQGSCRFFDAMVGDYPHGGGAQNRVHNKVVLDAMTGVTGTRPDVRVFNLSFGDARPLDSLTDVERRERLLDLQDLDNFAFENDALVIVAAGNSTPGEIPNEEYPDHWRDPRWALGAWACGFNSLVCGAFVGRATVGGLAGQVGWPSPCARVGPGLVDSPVPSFCAEGGDVDENYQYSPGFGVWCLSDQGLAEDKTGTSFAAPLLAREGAFVLSRLEAHCERGTIPFSVTARAFMTLTARVPTSDERVRELVEKTLGNGEASVDRLKQPTSGSAVILWQGYLESTKHVIRVQLPVPRDWLDEAAVPTARLVACADPPVNAAAPGIWACRRINVSLHPGPEERALSRPSGEHNSYPIIDRRYKLGRYKTDGERPANRDDWLIKLGYEEIAPYYAGAEFDPRQRVAFAVELLDEGEEQIDPQQALQALPMAVTMNRLSIHRAEVRTPIIVRTRRG